MADSKLTALTEETVPVDADLMYLVDDVAGTPTSKRITWANIKAAVRSALVSDTAYGSGWNGDTTTAPSKNAVYDEMELRLLKATHKVVTKDADESVTSNGTPQDDDHLSFAVAASEVWVVTYQLFVGAAGTGGDFRAQLSVPAGATVDRIGGMGFALGATGAEADVRGQAGTSAVAFGVTNVADTLVIISARVTVGGTAGSVTLQWSQQSSNASATTLRSGSFLVADLEPP